MRLNVLAEAARMFSDAAYETTYGSWTFEPDEYDHSIDWRELESALWWVGDKYLLEVDRYDGQVTLTLSTYYLKEGNPDHEYDDPYCEETGDEWHDAWETAAACRLFGYVSLSGSGWVKQERFITLTILGEYVPCNDYVLEKCKAIFGDYVDDLEHGNWTLHATVRDAVTCGREVGHMYTVRVQNLVKVIKESSGLTQKALSLKMGRGERYVDKLINSNNVQKITTLLELCEASGCELLLRTPDGKVFKIDE